ncbi:DUF4384 domain-containing protein [Haliscomenobacter hydrossis]|uniref:Uncharacterized protein n=1 Tax=Haliscomenobacter hydrossis (strain ATCC 27775 / DSM 1100 / LMG 10767 / O) TaxID=760192 RepID=F4KUW6_HALH1|nr:DUF4384 domain-containing protein [Haliscomenobacter hydrossis]AEE48142.1 hypothetical protein Halhy_0229 [Haliscomenobacter hydrossis DSM 1100]
MSHTPQSLKQLLARGRTDLVLNGLLEHTANLTDKVPHNTVIALSSRWKNNEAENNAGIIGLEDYKLEKSRINKAVLALIDELWSNESSGGVVSVVPSKFNWKKWTAIAVTTLGILGAIAEFSGWSLRDLFAHQTEQPRGKTDTTAQIKPDTTKDIEVESAQTQTRGVKLLQKPTSTKNTSASLPAPLHITCTSNKGRNNPQFYAGEIMRFYYSVNRPCHVRCIYQLADGRLVLFDEDQQANATQGIPTEIGAGFVAAAPFGPERLYLFASTAAFPTLHTKTDPDGYAFIVDGLPQALQKTRGFKKLQQIVETQLNLNTLEEKINQ